MNKKIKDILNDAEEILKKLGVLGIGPIPTFLYGVYGDLDLHRNTNVNQIRYSSCDVQYSANTPYDCAANAIANSDMRSIDKMITIRKISQ